MGSPRLDVAHIFFPHAPLLMTGRTRVPLALLRAPFLANLASLSWREAFLEVPSRGLLIPRRGGPTEQLEPVTFSAPTPLAQNKRMG